MATGALGTPEDQEADLGLWVVLTIALMLALALAVMNPLLSYYRKQDAQFVGAAGILLSYYGLGLSVAGFGLTWWQLARTRGAAVAAKVAVRRLKSDFASFDVLLELRTAKANAEECRRSLGHNDWPNALQGYHRLRSALLQMAAVRLGMSEATVSRLKDFAADATGAVLDLEAAARDPNIQVDVNALSSALLDMDAYFVELEHIVRDKISGR